MNIHSLMQASITRGLAFADTLADLPSGELAASQQDDQRSSDLKKGWSQDRQPDFSEVESPAGKDRGEDSPKPKPLAADVPDGSSLALAIIPLEPTQPPATETSSKPPSMLSSEEALSTTPSPSQATDLADPAKLQVALTTAPSPPPGTEPAKLEVATAPSPPPLTEPAKLQVAQVSAAPSPPQVTEPAKLQLAQVSAAPSPSQVTEPAKLQVAQVSAAPSPPQVTEPAKLQVAQVSAAPSLPPLKEPAKPEAAQVSTAPSLSLPPKPEVAQVSTAGMHAGKGMGNIPRLNDVRADRPPRDECSLTPSAIDKRLRRCMAPRVDGSFKVPMRFVHQWRKSGPARKSLEKILASCGYDTD